MTQPPRDRRTEPTYDEISYAALLGTKIRARRKERGLTLKALATQIGFSLQHLSEVELGKAPMSGRFVAACDLTLGAHGSLLGLLKAVVCERALLCFQQSITRQRSDGDIPDAEWEALTRVFGPERYADLLSLLSDADDDVEPLSRRNLLEAGAGATLALGGMTAPTAARMIDPGLVEHWMQLMQLLDRLGGVFGSREVLAAVLRELALIAEHRQTARGELCTQLLRVESRWSQFASWLSNDAGDPRQRDLLADQALGLAREGDYPEMVAYVLLRRSRWAIDNHDARRAVAFAESARSVRDTSPRMGALCALKQAHGYALANDAASCTSSLRGTNTMLEASYTARDDPLGNVAGHEISVPYVKAEIACCRLWLQPAQAITAFEDVLRIWPESRTRDRGVQQARLALACAAAREPERAASEGMKALGIVRTTKSDVTVRELKRLDQRLRGFDVPVVLEFREALAGV